MRTNIDLDEALIAEAREATGLTTKKAIVEEALRDLVIRYRQKRQLKALPVLAGRVTCRPCAAIVRMMTRYDRRR